MNCKAVQARLSAYLDRELTGDELLHFRAHLSRCPECRQEEQDLRALKMLLSTLPAPEPTEEMVNRLCRSVIRDESAPKGWNWKGSILAFASVAALSMILTFVLLGLGAHAPKPKPKEADFALDVAQDQTYDMGADPTSGVPVVPVSNYYGRR